MHSCGVYSRVMPLPYRRFWRFRRSGTLGRIRKHPHQCAQTLLRAPGWNFFDSVRQMCIWDGKRSENPFERTVLRRTGLLEDSRFKNDPFRSFECEKPTKNAWKLETGPEWFLQQACLQETMACTDWLRRGWWPRCKVWSHPLFMFSDYPDDHFLEKTFLWE